jgi:hypothetical protein
MGSHDPRSIGRANDLFHRFRIGSAVGEFARLASAHRPGSYAEAGEQGEMTDAEIARSRTQALECLGQAEQATSQTDKEIWLQMAEKWIELIEDAESKRRCDE